LRIELIRSWCFECPEAKCYHTERFEKYQIHKKLFAIIGQNQVSLKCSSEQYKELITHNAIEPAKGLFRYHWITINDVTVFSIEDLHEYLINSYELVVQKLSKRVRRKLLDQLSHDIDTPWKDILNVCFHEFIEFFYPAIEKDIDWTKAPLFMDKELSKIIKASKTGNRFVDKLVKVYRKTGEEKWVLTHIEIQGQPQISFSERMFIYSNRLHDAYHLKVASLAILADENPDWRPSMYDEELWGCQKTFKFPVVKLLDYNKKWIELETSDNPFAIVVMTHLKMLETKNNFTDRLYWKIQISNQLYAKGYSENKVFALLKFIDWLMVLPRDLSTSYNSFMHQIKEEKKMRFITSFELIGMEKGMEKGIEKGMEKGKKVGEKKGIIMGQIETLKQMFKMKYLPKRQFDLMIKPLKLELAKLS